MYYSYFQSPVGPFLVAGDGISLTMTSFSTGHQSRAPESDWVEDASRVHPALQQLDEYFGGQRKHFDLPLRLEGTEFQKRVWNTLLTIPFGETRSYLDVATALGRATACRAVGAANGANVMPIIVPCHRVIGSNGSLTGFGGGLETKDWLLRFEGAIHCHQKTLF